MVAHGSFDAAGIHPAVLAVKLNGVLANCTATMVSPHLALSAASCFITGALTAQQKVARLHMSAR